MSRSRTAGPSSSWPHLVTDLLVAVHVSRHPRARRMTDDVCHVLEPDASRRERDTAEWRASCGCQRPNPAASVTSASANGIAGSSIVPMVLVKTSPRVRAQSRYRG